MPADRTSLASGLRKLFEGDPSFPGSAAAAGQRWADLYRSYAGTTMAAAAAPLPPALSAAGATLATGLGAAFTSAQQAGAGGAPILISAVQTALIAFWLTPPVAFAGVGLAGLVTLAPPGLAALLGTAFAAGAGPGASAAGQADLIATALDTFTKTVMVTNTPTSPPGPPLPPVPLV